MSDLVKTIDTYLAAWNEPDSARRASLIGEVWAPDGQLVDPPVAGEGHDGISQVAAAVHEQFPGHRFRRSSGVDAHHDVCRFTWELVAPDGTVTLSGLDVALLGGDGRLARVSGFFGAVPGPEEG